MEAKKKTVKKKIAISQEQTEKVSNNTKSNIIRLIIFGIFFVIFFCICLTFASKTLEREKLKPINYSQKGSIDYKVYLNNNEFYEQEYLDMNKAYIASLIKYIDVNFNYNFKIAKLSDIDFDYKIIGELVIENASGNGRYFEKQYTLSESKKNRMYGNNNFNIKENIQIDYDYYNKLANQFRITYGVDTNSYLNLYLDVNAKSNEKLNYKISENNITLLKIPLSERAIEINFDQNNSEVIKQVIPFGKIIFNVKYLVLESIFFIITIICFLKLVKYIVSLMKNITAYDRYVNKLLKEYDRLIVETYSDVNKTKCNIIEINEFTELLDVRDNLKAPIVYYNIKEHEKGIFYIKNQGDIYLLTIDDKELRRKRK